MDQQYKTQALKNMVVNRFQLKQKRKVGPTSQSIRECQPKSLEEWEAYYYENCVHGNTSRVSGGACLSVYGRTSSPPWSPSPLRSASATLQDLVIRKTYEGYVAEIEAVRALVEGRVGRV